ncbi:hypothetical protein [Burkholderia pyrrocinia]|uniref:hypothetical protein n=1 Tax=Burkholderia pyrrocinia TaxID=60550 RepID=UPI001043965C|nr:hypothetical protein [Burkholderia pyrrocinia]TDA48282.1 hypothetical protein EVG18_06295 [Burkholderia pyrrocinia]
MKFDDNLIRMMNQIGYFLRSKGVHLAALNVFDALHAFQPTRSYPILGRAFVYAEMGEFRKAERDFHTVLARQPGHSLAEACLGLTQLHLGYANWRAPVMRALVSQDDNGGQVLAEGVLKAANSRSPASSRRSTMDRLNRHR